MIMLQAQHHSLLQPRRTMPPPSPAASTNMRVAVLCCAVRTRRCFARRGWLSSLILISATGTEFRSMHRSMSNLGVLQWMRRLHVWSSMQGKPSPASPAPAFLHLHCIVPRLLLCATGVRLHLARIVGAP